MQDVSFCPCGVTPQKTGDVPAGGTAGPGRLLALDLVQAQQALDAFQLAALAGGLGSDGDQQDKAQDHLLPEGVDAVQVQAVADTIAHSTV